MVNISCCKVFFFCTKRAKEKDDATSIFPWDEEGRARSTDRTCVCARATGDSSPVLDRGEEKWRAGVDIHRGLRVERTVNGRKRRRHNRSRYGIINAVPLNFCAPLSSNSLRPTSSLRTRRRKKNKIGTRWIAKKRKGRGSMAVGGGSCVSEAALSRWVNKFRF